jgi:hypothetical protein
MTDDDKEFPQSTGEQIGEPRALWPDSVQAELPEVGGDSKPIEALTEAERPLGEPAENAPPELQAHQEPQSPADTPPQPRESQTPGVELQSAEPGAPPPPPAVPEPAKPRSLFPALAATALAGAILGLGGSYGLRFLESAPSNPPASDGRLTEFSARLDAIESKQTAAASTSRSALSALETRLAAAEEAVRNAAELAKAAEADVQKAAASQKEIASQNETASPDLGPFESRLTALEQRLAKSGPEAAPKTTARAERDLESAPAKEAARAQEVAIVADSLLRKLDHGEEFSAELAALENLGIPEPSLAPLRAASASAVSTERELAAQFANLSAKIIAAQYAAPAGQEESLLDRLARSAKSLVDVRHVGDSSAADVESLVTRIESALANHEIEVAYKAWAQLPGAAKNAALSWGEAAKSRLDAINAAKSIEAGAVAVLGKPEPKAAETRN